MIKPDDPPDERGRLQTLRSLDILDTPPEERFDRLTRMAKRMFGVPIALVSLIDENRQWFKSSVGLDARETPRDVSFCGHAILGEDVFVVPDAKADDRFADNPLVAGDPHVRFYAGRPLRALNGKTLGTLCVIDREPRSFGADDLEALEDLASVVERELAAFQMATRDELTDLSNRRGFMVLAEHSVRFFDRQQIAAALVYFDLDGFKQINDTLGHAEGDHALRAFADHMKGTFRDSDLCARMGGDEFVALLASTTSDVAAEVVGRFAQSIAAYNREADRGYDLSFSHGVVGFDPERHRSVDALLAEADQRMYEVKRAR